MLQQQPNRWRANYPRCHDQKIRYQSQSTTNCMDDAHFMHTHMHIPTHTQRDTITRAVLYQPENTLDQQPAANIQLGNARKHKQTECSEMHGPKRKYRTTKMLIIQFMRDNKRQTEHPKLHHQIEIKMDEEKEKKANPLEIIKFR